MAGGDNQPGPRVCGLTVPRPALGGDRERLLSGLLGEIEVAEEADQRGKDAAPLLAENALDQGAYSTTGRTSTASPSRRAGIRPAIERAVSRSLTSNR
jgi:hypothetical protein